MLKLDCCGRESRGIGFVEFADPLDAEDGIRGLDRMVLEGKEVCLGTHQLQQVQPKLSAHAAQDACAVAVWRVLHGFVPAVQAPKHLSPALPCTMQGLL